VIVNFDKLHLGKQKSRQFVPFLGDIMTARWSFEALAVKQLRDNKYERNFFRNDMKIAEYTSYIQLTDNLATDLDYCTHFRDTADQKDFVKQKYFLINKYIGQLAEKAGIQIPDSLKSALVFDKPDLNADRKMYLWMRNDLKERLKEERAKFRDDNSKIAAELQIKFGEDILDRLRTTYENDQLRRLMVGDLSLTGDLVVTIGDRKISKVSPGFLPATSNYGRSHFYAPYKWLGNKEFDTFKFNLAVIWFVTLLLYVALYFRLLSKGMNYFGGLKFQKSET
jgi:hypothetical protein